MSARAQIKASSPPQLQARNHKYVCVKKYVCARAAAGENVDRGCFGHRDSPLQERERERKRERERARAREREKEREREREREKERESERQREIERETERQIDNR